MMTPPNGDSGSVANARSHACTGSPPVPTPHGVLCFRIAIAASASPWNSERERHGRVDVDDVVVRELLPVQRLGDLQEVAVERRLLVRVLAVAHVDRLRPAPVEASGRSGPRPTRRGSRRSCRRRPAVVWKTFCARRRFVATLTSPPADCAAPPRRPRSRRDRRSRSRARGSSPPSAASTARRCRCSRSPPRA